jgi:hypothetical protein
MACTGTITFTYCKTITLRAPKILPTVTSMTTPTKPATGMPIDGRQFVDLVSRIKSRKRKKWRKSQNEETEGRLSISV